MTGNLEADAAAAEADLISTLAAEWIARAGGRCWIAATALGALPLHPRSLAVMIDRAIASDAVLVTPEAGPGRTLLIESAMALAALNALHEHRSRDLVERAVAMIEGPTKRLN